MLKNMFPTIVQAAVVVLSAVGLSMLFINWVVQLKSRYYNKPSKKARYLEHMIDLMNKNKTKDPALKANAFSTISNLTEKQDKIVIEEIYKPRLEELKRQRYWSERRRCQDIWRFFEELRRDNDQTFKKIAEISDTIECAARWNRECGCGCGHSHSGHNSHNHNSEQNPDDVTNTMFNQRRMIHVERYMAVEGIEKEALRELARRALEDKSGDWFGVVLGWVTAANAMVEKSRVAVDKMVASTRKGGESKFAACFLIQERILMEKKVEALNVVCEALKDGAIDNGNVEAVMNRFGKVIDYMPTNPAVAKEYDKLSKKLN